MTVRMKHLQELKRAALDLLMEARAEWIMGNKRGAAVVYARYEIAETVAQEYEFRYGRHERKD